MAVSWNWSIVTCPLQMRNGMIRCLLSRAWSLRISIHWRSSRWAWLKERQWEHFTVPFRYVIQIWMNTYRVCIIAEFLFKYTMVVLLYLHFQVGSQWSHIICHCASEIPSLPSYCSSFTVYCPLGPYVSLRLLHFLHIACHSLFSAHCVPVCSSDCFTSFIFSFISLYSVLYRVTVCPFCLLCRPIPTFSVASWMCFKVTLIFGICLWSQNWSSTWLILSEMYTEAAHQAIFHFKTWTGNGETFYTIDCIIN